MVLMKKVFMLIAAAALLLVSGVNASQEFAKDDEILELPGWSPRRMPSKQYSGFLDSNSEGTLSMHYWFVEAEDGPDTSPLVVWFNGGPGASSLYGLLVELGPFILSDLSMQGAEYEKTGIPQLIYNPYGWQKTANILALSMPPPVGFSYCTPPGPSAQGNDCGAWNDTSTAIATYTALSNWFKRFPSYKENDLFIAGESYAGVYVPMLVQQILAHPQLGLNLQGFAVGDACTPPDLCGSKKTGPYWKIQFLYGKTAFSNALFEEINEVCTQDELVNGGLTAKCSESVSKIDSEVGAYWDYGYYDACWYENDIRRNLRTGTSELEVGAVGAARPYYGPPIFSSSSSFFSAGVRWNERERRASDNKADKRENIAAGSSVREEGSRENDEATAEQLIGGNGYPCGGPAAQITWLEQPAVRKALHIPVDASFFQCDNGDDFTYELTEHDLVSWYKEIVPQNKLRILVYNGDTDPGINAYAAQNWTRNLGFEPVQTWRPWTLDGCQRMAGYVTRYENNFDFLTIRGSGQMVPLHRPQSALEFMSRFLLGEDYPAFDASCSEAGAGAAAAAGGGREGVEGREGGETEAKELGMGKNVKGDIADTADGRSMETVRRDIHRLTAEYTANLESLQAELQRLGSVDSD